MAVLKKENEYLPEEIERKEFKLFEVQNRIEELQCDVSKLAYSLFNFE